MDIVLITRNSAGPSKRPTAAQIIPGELALNTGSTDPGLYFEDSAGNIRKVSGCHVGGTGPNSTPSGQAGNSAGELWYDTAQKVLKVYDGVSWISTGVIIKAAGLINLGGAPPVHPDNATAQGAGLLPGDVYRKADGTLMVVF